MTARIIALSILSLVLLGACSTDPEPGEHVWKTQTDTLDTAKNIDNLVQDTYKQQRKKIDD